MSRQYFANELTYRNQNQRVGSFRIGPCPRSRTFDPWKVFEKSWAESSEPSRVFSVSAYLGIVHYVLYIRTLYRSTEYERTILYSVRGECILHCVLTQNFFKFDSYTVCSFTAMQIFQLIVNFFRKPLKE